MPARSTGRTINRKRQRLNKRKRHRTPFFLRKRKRKGLRKRKRQHRSSDHLQCPHQPSPHQHPSSEVDVAMNEQYDSGYDTGYNNGYNDALQLINKEVHSDFNEGYADGFNKGLYTGGEGIVDELLPFDVILPQYDVKQIITLGLEQLQPQYDRLLLGRDIHDMIIAAMEQRKPLSIIRLGDGELLTLSQECVYNSDEVLRQGKFLEYAGVKIPDLKARDEVAQSVRAADIVGIPKLRLPNYLPLMLPVFNAHGIDYKQLKLTFSTINYILHTEHLLAQILQGRRILVIGNVAEPFTAFLAAQGFKVATPVTSVQGVHDVTRVLGEVAKRTFDIALVSAGIAAVIIAEKIASQFGKVAFDFGHLADSLISGEAKWHGV